MKPAFKQENRHTGIFNVSVDTSTGIMVQQMDIKTLLLSKIQRPGNPGL